jgi:polysaccharide biosynthesis PFTS motif protein
LTFRNPIACLLWRDFAEHAAVSVMNKNKLIEAVIITNTNWFQQFLWMTDLSERHFETYMALYSLNSSALKFKDDPIAATHPGIRHLRADLIWIWDAFYEKVLNHEGIFSRMEVVSPILWHLPKKTLIRKKDEFQRICIFDVSPMGPDALLNRGMLGNYYSTETMRSYLDDILAAVDEVKLQLGCEIEILLKHKRIPSPQNDDCYFNYVNALCKSNNNLGLVEENKDLFELIAESDLVVVIPYSSPAYVANYQGIPAIFYDPTNELQPGHEIIPSIIFSAGLVNLKKEIKKIIARSIEFSKRSN